MAFLLLSIDKKPMRLKGNSVLASVAVHSGEGGVTKGAYRGVRSQTVIHVVGGGGVAFPVDEAKMAFEASKPVPLTLESSALEVPDVLNEIFVSEGEAPSYREGVMSLTPLPSVLEGYWIPVRFENGSGRAIADGWINQHGGSLDFRMLARSIESNFSFATVVPSHAPELSFASE